MVDPVSHPMFRPLPQGAHPALAPLSAIIGSWVGEGVGGYPDLESDFRYRQELSFTPLPGKPVLGYESRTWNAETQAPLATEVGFWRVQGDRTIEVMLAHPFGIVEIYVGDIEATASGFKLDLEDNATVRTGSARTVERSHRLYGLVDGDLAYVVEMEAEGHPMTPHLSAQLLHIEE